MTSFIFYPQGRLNRGAGGVMAIQKFLGLHTYIAN